MPGEYHIRGDYSESGALDDDRHTDTLELAKHDGEHDNESRRETTDGYEGPKGQSPAGHLHQQSQTEIFLTEASLQDSSSFCITQALLYIREWHYDILYLTTTFLCANLSLLQHSIAAITQEKHGLRPNLSPSIERVFNSRISMMTTLISESGSLKFKREALHFT